MRIISEYLETAKLLIEPMLKDHYDEVGNKVLYELDPDWDKYRAIDENGNGIWLLVLDFDKCVGYSFNLLTPHLHYKGSTICYNDVIYIDPAYRHTSIGGRLMAATRKEATRMGATVMQWHAKFDTPLSRTLDKRVKPFELAYQEAL